MYYFLEGARGVGKSTLLRELLSPHTRQLAGFAVQRLFLDNKQQGFRAVPLTEGYPAPCGIWQEGLSGVFIQCGSTDLRALETAIRAALEAARQANCRMILLDEIGGIELAEPTIMRDLDELLSLGKPCIGVLKSADNLQHIATSTGLDVAHTLELHTKLSTRLAQNGQIVTLCQENYNASRMQIERFLSRHLGV